jgi:hypothetical protein
MQSNPYTPPSSSVSATQEKLAPRPISVWLLILLLLAVTTLFTFGTAQFLGRVVSHSFDAKSPMWLAVAVVWRIAVVAALVAATLYTIGRRHWARWIGLLPAAGLAAFSIFGPDTTSYANEGERFGGLMARVVVIPIFSAWWAYALVFSDKTKRYFHRK